jgi:hypothetical protein
MSDEPPGGAHEAVPPYVSGSIGTSHDVMDHLVGTQSVTSRRTDVLVNRGGHLVTRVPIFEAYVGK